MYQILPSRRLVHLSHVLHMRSAALHTWPMPLLQDSWGRDPPKAEPRPSPGAEAFMITVSFARSRPAQDFTPPVTPGRLEPAADHEEEVSSCSPQLPLHQSDSELIRRMFTEKMSISPLLAIGVVSS